MKKLSTYILRSSHLYILSVLCLIIQVGLDMLSPQITKRLIDDVLGNGEWALLPWLLTGIAAKDLIFDPLALTISSEQEAALEPGTYDLDSLRRQKI